MGSNSARRETTLCKGKQLCCVRLWHKRHAILYQKQDYKTIKLKTLSKSLLFFFISIMHSYEKVWNRHRDLKKSPPSGNSVLKKPKFLYAFWNSTIMFQTRCRLTFTGGEDRYCRFFFFSIHNIFASKQLNALSKAKIWLKNRLNLVSFTE